MKSIFLTILSAITLTMHADATIMPLNDSTEAQLDAAARALQAAGQIKTWIEPLVFEVLTKNSDLCDALIRSAITYYAENPDAVPTGETLEEAIYNDLIINLG